MQPIKRLTPFIAVAAQLEPADMGTLAASGFRTVINNRPDHEGEGQPSSAAMQAAAEASGLDYHHLPVVSGQITDTDVEAFRTLLDQVKGPALAFCRSGTRSTTLWALAEAHHLDPDALLATARDAGSTSPPCARAWSNAGRPCPTLRSRPPASPIPRATTCW